MALRAFIVRPFGTKSPCQSERDIDFDRVESELIAPALSRLGLQGGTTIKFLEAGNIREDMFGELVRADLVVADVSVHNANVFYELGIRHALRDKRTFLLRCRGDAFPFDLQTDRYLEYDAADPGQSLNALVDGLRATLAGDRVDSPVFRLLPQLRAQDVANFVVVPDDFREEVERAADRRWLGDLEMLGDEAEWFGWAAEGRREVGRAQFSLRAWESARVTWERVLDENGQDLEANAKLATIYQRLGNRARSNQSIRRALDHAWTSATDRAELYSLLGSNVKSEWMEVWANLTDEQRGPRALADPSLTTAFDHYRQGFAEDPSHYYSGVNALALSVIITELAERYPETWQGRFEDEEEAASVLSRYGKDQYDLTGAVRFSVEAARQRAKVEGRSDLWAEITNADMVFLTSKKPARVALVYRKALAGALDFSVSAARRQLAIYKSLRVKDANADAALEVLDELEARIGIASIAEQAHVVVFTGHMIDAPDRQAKGLAPRFPPKEQYESKARVRIKAALTEQLARHGDQLLGIAGGACGGDILFHEVCEELGIPTRLFLAIPQKDYVLSSVQHGGQQWVVRFEQLCSRLKDATRVLSGSKELPRWLRKRSDYSIWQRSNLWLLHNALALSGMNTTLIALWNGEQGDAPGGTADMVARAKERLAEVIHLDTREIFGL
jgi:hypothetical protein